MTKPAASASLRVSLTGKEKSSIARASSAKAPWPRKKPETPITRSPTLASAPAPDAVTTPTTSWPGVNGREGVSA
jgi:hypothetical protein